MRCIRLRSFAFVSLCGLGLFGPLRGEAAVTLVAAVNGASYVNSSLPNGKLAQGALFVGSPETVAQKIAWAARTLGLARFQMKYSVGSLPHEQRLESIRLYGEEVIPRVRELLAAG